MPSVGVNSTVGAIFNGLEDIARNPPTSVEGNTAVWGPGSGDALDGLRRDVGGDDDFFAHA